MKGVESVVAGGKFLFGFGHDLADGFLAGFFAATELQGFFDRVAYAFPGRGLGF